MNDLRHDPADPTDAHAPDLRERTRLNPADLRTVAMPELRSADARNADAETRDLRTGPQRVDGELAVLREAIERLADSVTILMLERELRQLKAHAPAQSDTWEVAALAQRVSTLEAVARSQARRLMALETGVRA